MSSGRTYRWLARDVSDTDHPAAARRAATSSLTPRLLLPAGGYAPTNSTRGRSRRSAGCVPATQPLRLVIVTRGSCGSAHGPTAEAHTQREGPMTQRDLM